MEGGRSPDAPRASGDWPPNTGGVLYWMSLTLPSMNVIFTFL